MLALMTKRTARVVHIKHFSLVPIHQEYLMREILKVYVFKEYS